MESHLRSPRFRPSAFTLVELLTVIGIIAILAALAFPVISVMKKNGQMTKSLHNIRGGGSALLGYAAENNGQFPLLCATSYKSPFWTESVANYLAPAVTGLVFPGVKTTPSLQSPLLKAGQHHGISDYAANTEVMLRNTSSLNADPLRLASVPRPAETAMLITAIEKKSPLTATWYVESWAYVNGSTSLGPNDHASGKIQIAYIDGHVGTLTQKELDANKKAILLVDPSTHPSPYNTSR